MKRPTADGRGLDWLLAIYYHLVEAIVVGKEEYSVAYFFIVKNTAHMAMKVNMSATTQVRCPRDMFTTMQTAYSIIIRFIVAAKIILFCVNRRTPLH